MRLQQQQRKRVTFAGRTVTSLPNGPVSRMVQWPRLVDAVCSATKRRRLQWRLDSVVGGPVILTSPVNLQFIWSRGEEEQKHEADR